AAETERATRRVPSPRRGVRQGPGTPGSPGCALTPAGRDRPRDIAATGDGDWLGRAEARIEPFMTETGRGVRVPRRGTPEPSLAFAAPPFSNPTPDPRRTRHARVAIKLPIT